NNALANFTTFTGNIYHLGLNGSISSSADTDYFRIGQLQVGDILTVQYNGAASLRGALSDPYVYLYRGSDSAPVLVASNDDGGTGLDSMIYRFAITTTDQYFVDASIFSGT